jgi:hypothetical protein
MPKRVTGRKRPQAKRRAWLSRVAVALLTISLLVAGVALARRRSPPVPSPFAQQDDVTPPSPPAAVFSATTPSKEYIYAGGRLVATEEPTAAAPPIAPSSLTVDFNNRLLVWTDNSVDELGFKIERRSWSGGVWTGWSQINTVGPNVASCSVGVKGCGAMQWRVRAYNAGGDSPYSNVADACWYYTDATVYDAVDDFSPSQNPSGPWSYGYRASGGGAFSPLTSNDNVYGLPAGMHTWYLPGVWNLPAVIHNGTGTSQSYFGAVQPTTVLNLYPGANGEKSVVRWTAQGPGTAQIAGRFEGLDATTTGVSVVKNGSTSLFTGNITGLSNQAPFSLSLTVVAGDTIEFQVYYNGDVQHDSTGLAANVTVQGPPPPLTFNAVNDFSPTQNQSAAWAYGYRPAGGGSFAVLPNNDNLYGLPAGMHTWYLPGVWNLPAVFHNGTGTSQSYYGVTQPTDLLNLFPGGTGEKAVVRWTASRAGTAQITGRFQGLDATTTGVTVVKNGTTTLANGNVNGFGNQAAFSLTVAVASGDTIEFQVYYNGDVQHDSTGLAAVITLQ